MKTEHTNVGWGFWIAWVLVSILGFGMGAIVGAGIAWGIFPREGFDATIGVTVGLVIGAAGGFLQWVVLREKVARAGWWILASVLGSAIALGALGAVGISENYVMAGILFAAVFGVAGGVLQWLVLRHAGIARAGWWVPASILGSLVAAIAIPASAAVTYNLGAMVGGVLFGVGLGAIPGAALVWLLRQSQSGNVEGMASAH